MEVLGLLGEVGEGLLEGGVGAQEAKVIIAKVPSRLNKRFLFLVIIRLLSLAKALSGEIIYEEFIPVKPYF